MAIYAYIYTYKRYTKIENTIDKYISLLYFIMSNFGFYNIVQLNVNAQMHNQHFAADVLKDPRHNNNNKKDDTKCVISSASNYRRTIVPARKQRDVLEYTGKTSIKDLN